MPIPVGMRDRDLARLIDLLARPMFLPDARRLAEAMLAAEVRRRREIAMHSACVVGEGRIRAPASSLEEPMRQHEQRSSSPERASAAAPTRFATQRAGATAPRHGIPRLDTRSGGSVDEPSTASPGAVDLTLLHDEVRGGARVLAAAVIGPCVLIAFFILLALFA